jgi:hypothetical protein
LWPAESETLEFIVGRADALSRAILDVTDVERMLRQRVRLDEAAVSAACASASR